MDNILEEYLKCIKENSEMNKKLLEVLSDIENYIDINDNESLTRLEIAKNLAEGYIIYKKKDLIKELEITKTALTYLTQKLREENKLSVIKIDNITMVKLK